jgi:rubrerythrin
MEDEYGKTLEAIQFAIQMEIDGKQYYQKASRESGNKVGRELFEWLAAEEDKHRQRFEGIYNTIKEQKAWPEVNIQPRKGDILNTLFSEVMRASATDVKAASTELDAIAKAMEFENKTEKFYTSQGEKAVYDAERKLYTSLAAEERGHYLALVDYREYLIDPAGWFRKEEHHSLDGG